jgi:hypothetical protein
MKQIIINLNKTKMKTTLFALLSTVIFTLALAGNATAATKDNAKESNSSSKATKANNKALRKFTMTYKDAAGASWSMNKDVMIATFSKDEVKTNVMYSKNGSWLHTFTYYPENKTPQDIASIMDYAYPKDDIKQTIKVEEGNMLVYIVQLEGKTTYKKVSVYNGEVNQIEELTKSN